MANPILDLFARIRAKDEARGVIQSVRKRFEKLGGALKSLKGLILTILFVFPTRAGMNRTGAGDSPGCAAVPRTGGDEPYRNSHSPAAGARAPRKCGWPRRAAFVDFPACLC